MKSDTIFKLNLLFLSINLVCSCSSGVETKKPDIDIIPKEDIEDTQEIDTVSFQTNTGITIYKPINGELKPRVLLCTTLNNTIDSIYYYNDTILERSIKMSFWNTILTNLEANGEDSFTTYIIYALIIDKKEKQISYYLELPGPYKGTPESTIIEQSLIECIKSKRTEIFRKAPRNYRYFYIINALQMIG